MPDMLLPRTGQWRSVYNIDPKAGSITGRIHVDVHYFENGNVSFPIGLPASPNNRS
jgi:hypothetical protein